MDAAQPVVRAALAWLEGIGGGIDMARRCAALETLSVPQGPQAAHPPVAFAEWEAFTPSNG